MEKFQYIRFLRKISIYLFPSKNFELVLFLQWNTRHSDYLKIVEENLERNDFRKKRECRKDIEEKES